MALLRIDIAGNPKTVPFRTLLQIGSNSMGVLEDYDHAFSHASRSVTDWYINDISTNGRLRVELYSRLRKTRREMPPDLGERVARHFVSGFKVLEKEGTSPAYLTDEGMQRAQRLTNAIGQDGARALIASLPQETKEVVAEITHKTAENIARLLPAASVALGSVEGHLEGINLHNRPRFIVYEHRTGKAVTCLYGNLKLMETIKSSLEKRVIVSGKLARNAKGEPLRITLASLEDLRVLGSEDLKILPFKKLRGSDPDFTGEMTTEEFIRSIRG
jgi:hypothetical protein